MVLRKVSTQLGLQADYHQTQNLFQNHDVKNSKGADLKKKMKKSGSIKHPKQAGKPLSPSPPTQLPAQKITMTPNYMKSTTSSDARKEQSQSPYSSSLREKSSDSSKFSASSCKKAAKTFLGRTLTKNPSFKPARASARKCSPVVLCEDFGAQRATCSSTLKDCKFPAYLSLNPGGTESEGTSAVKVCPYTYCSLNGHHHAPMPPLKCFVSARRRMIKSQRSVKLGCLSPRGVKPAGDGALVEEENKDFFIEIYSKEEEGTADGRDSSTIDDETSPDDQEERVLETLLDAPIRDEVDAQEDENRHGKSMDICNSCFSEKNQDVEVDEVTPPLSVEEESSLDFMTELPYLYEVEDSDASDMDWEKGYHPAPNLDGDYNYEYSPATDIEPDPEADADDEFAIKPGSKDCFFDEFFEEVSQESYAESLNSDAFSSSDDGEFTGFDHLESLNSEKTSAPVEVQEKESEPVLEEETHILPETSFDNLNNQPLPDKDPVQTMGEVVSDLENSDADIATLSTDDSGKEPHSEGAQLNLMEADLCISGRVKAANAEREDCALDRFKPKKPVEDSDELGTFNPRAPNFLPLEPCPESEKVDLKHQDLDERKNSEEWMVDYALRKVVTKLAPARKRKVALLVEAFEKVMPTTICDLHIRHGSAFDQARPMQACI